MEARERLIGKWMSIGADGEETTAEFMADGRLEFTFHGETKDQKMLLTYAIQGDDIITNQPSHPREERTQFEFTDRGDLVLIYDGTRTSYQRRDASKSP
jgi:hypothetical protein